MDRKKLVLLCGGIAVVLGLSLVALGAFLQEEPGQTTGPALLQTDPVQTTLPPQTTVPETTVPETTAPEETKAPEQHPTYPETEPTEPPETVPDFFPVELEGGMLTVRGIFPFTGLNPDANDQFGEEIAGIQMTNTSDEYLRHAEVTAILSDGTTLTFRVEDVPAGRTVVAFALEHEPLGRGVCEDLYGFGRFERDDFLRTDLVRTTVQGTEITVKNVSGKTLKNLDVYCHGLLDTSCFGGTTYHYTISELKAGAETTIHADECYLGAIEVVRIAQSD